MVVRVVEEAGVVEGVRGVDDAVRVVVWVELEHLVLPMLLQANLQVMNSIIARLLGIMVISLREEEDSIGDCRMYLCISGEKAFYKLWLA